MPETTAEGKNLAHALVSILLMLTVVGICVSIFSIALTKLNAINDSARGVMQTASYAKLNALSNLAETNETVSVTEMASALIELTDVELAYVSITHAGATTYYAYEGTSINGVTSTSIHYSDNPYNEAAQVLLTATGSYGYLTTTDYSGALAVSIYY